MPIYEFRCRRCDERFEERRAMRDADAPATCAQGHLETVRLLPAFAATGFAAPAAAGCGQPSGGCCGGVCAPA
jgi:putative FmdB family regulatory protein